MTEIQNVMAETKVTDFLTHDETELRNLIFLLEKSLSAVQENQLHRIIHLQQRIADLRYMQMTHSLDDAIFGSMTDD